MKLEQHDTTAIVVEKGGKFLVVKRGKPPEKGFWAVPGGHVEEGETAWECAQREAKEEVGEVEVGKECFLKFTHDVKVGHRHNAHFFKGKVVGELRAASDAAELAWKTPEELAQEETTHYTKKLVNWMIFGD